jgi:hypothetical protein
MPTAKEAEKHETKVQRKVKEKYWAPDTCSAPLDSKGSNPYKQ